MILAEIGRLSGLVKLISKYAILASLPFVCITVPALPVHAQNSTAENTKNLQNALRRIARNSNDSSALADAGLAALRLGDTRAAIGFLAKADQIYPRSGRVKAGLARSLLEEQNPFGALRYFNDALANGIPLREIAADRGLAYDLIGRNGEAQKDYELAMRTDNSDELLLRYAVSLGISGNIEGSDEKLNPLLQKSDRDAWRNRAFILAMNGKGKDANAIARQTMERRMANAIKPFFDRMPKLTAAQKAAAVHFGHFPASENIGVDVASVRYAANSAVRGGDGADAGLIPLGQPLGEEVKKPRVLAMPDTSGRRRPGARRGEEVRRVTRRELRRLERQGVKYKILSQSELPPPDGAKKSVKPLIEDKKKPAIDVAKQAPVKNRPAPATKQPELAAASSAPELSARAGGTKDQATKKALAAKTPPVNPAPAKAAGASQTQPGFETPLGTWVSSTGTIVGKTPAANPEPKPSTVTAKPTVLAAAQPPKPLVSESVTRKVGIGPAKPPVTKKPTNLRPPVQEPSAATTTVAQQAAVKAPPKPENQPVQMASFDLNSVPKQTTSTPPVQVAQADVSNKPLADIMKAISIPDEERKSEVVPVDLEKITPAKAKPKVEPKAEEKKPEPKTEEPKHPKRYWVQIATGRNRDALKYDYRRMAKKNRSLFNGKSGWTSPWGRTRRLVVGPFDSLGAAKKFDATFRKGGGDSFAWVSKQGTEVNKLTK